MRRLRAAVLAGVLATALTGCAAEQPDAAAPQPDLARADAPFSPCPEQLDRAADGGGALPALVFDCVGGGSLDLQRAPGVPTLVNLWGSWCTPCRDELPLLQEFADVAGDRVRVIGLISKDGVPQATSFGVDAGITFPSAFDGEGELMAELGLNGLPYTAFLDADGRLVHSELGPVDSVAELQALVTEHLGVAL